MTPRHSRPNLLLIMADQFRHDYLGSAGAAFVRTPNLDRLASRGVRITQCTTNNPICAPARIGLAAGLQPVRVGSLDNNSYLPASVPTYYQRLRDAGYRVGCVGKLDLAKPDPYNGWNGDRPCIFGWGFTHPEECEGKMHAGTSPTPIGPYTRHLHERGLLETFFQDYEKRRKVGYVNAMWDSALPTDAFEDAYIGRRAAEWIASARDDFPWHYFVSFVGPHDPFDPPAEYADRYRKAEMPAAILDSFENKPRSHARKPLDPAEVAVARRQYCAAIELIDEYIGRILEALDRRGMTENTYILFCSDHGEMLGDHGRYTKCSAYEASLRVPLLAAGPGIAGGRTSDAMVELIDVNPTLCELAGLPPQENIDARSIAGLLCGREPAHRTETVAEYRTFRCIRTERYKLVENHGDIKELYDLEHDPRELCNLASQEKKLVGDLTRRMHSRFMEGKWRH